MGRENVGKGINVALGPMMNIGRNAQGGRNWEGFGADPFLSGEAAYETILGMQEGGVQACAKHLINKYVLRRWIPGVGLLTCPQRAGAFPHTRELGCGRPHAARNLCAPFPAEYHGGRHLVRTSLDSDAKLIVPQHHV